MTSGSHGTIATVGGLQVIFPRYSLPGEHQTATYFWNCLGTGEENGLLLDRSWADRVRLNTVIRGLYMVI